LQWLQYPEENYAENLNNVRRKVGRHIRKKREDNGNVKLIKKKKKVIMRISENSIGT
jgi:methyl coenzyme M reductase beta subunit